MGGLWMVAAHSTGSCGCAQHIPGTPAETGCRGYQNMDDIMRFQSSKPLKNILINNMNNSNVFRTTKNI